MPYLMRRKGSRWGSLGLPSRRRFLLAGQSNCSFMNITLVEAELSGDSYVTRKAAGGTGFANGWWSSTADGGPGTWSQNMFTELDSQPAREWRAVLWNQWESDATAEADADAYQAKLENLIAEARSYTHPQLWWFLVLANPDSTRAYHATIRTAQLAIAAADPYVGTVNLDDLTIASGAYDGVHYQTAGSGRATMSTRSGEALETVP